MYSSRIVEAIEIPNDGVNIEVSSLYAVLSQVGDQRCLRRRRYSAGMVLTLLTLRSWQGKPR